MTKDEKIAAILAGGRYEADRHGQFLDRKTGRYVATRVSRSGVVMMNLATGDTPRQITVVVARAVLIAFTGVPEAGLGAVHVNGDRTDHRPCNLRWMDSHQTMQHASRIGALRIHKGSSHANAKLREVDVRSIRRLRVKGLTQQAIADRFGVARELVREVLAGRAWAHA